MGKKINFSRIEFKTDISGKNVFVQDIREDFANLVYTKCSGIAALELARKIYNSKDEEEYDDSECELIRACADTCTPQLIESITKLLE